MAGPTSPRSAVGKVGIHGRREGRSDAATSARSSRRSIVRTGLLYSILYSSARVLSTITLAALSFANPAVAVLVDVMV